MYRFKVVFYKGKESFGEILEHYKTVEVEFKDEPLEAEVIYKGLMKLGTFPKSYTAKVYKIEDSPNLI